MTSGMEPGLRGLGSAQLKGKKRKDDLADVCKVERIHWGDELEKGTIMQ